MHSHKHTPAPRWLNCALMHLQSQIQPLMAPTCINASLHTQNALNQLKSSALWIECAQVHLMTQIKTYNAGMHTCTSNASKYLERAPIQHLCTSKLEMASKTSKLLQGLFKTPPRLQKRLQEPSRSESFHLQQTQNLKISLNAHKQSNL